MDEVYGSVQAAIKEECLLFVLPFDHKHAGLVKSMGLKRFSHTHRCKFSRIAFIPSTNHPKLCSHVSSKHFIVDTIGGNIDKQTKSALFVCWSRRHQNNLRF